MHQVVVDATLNVFELINLLAKGIRGLLFLNCFQIFNDVIFCVVWALVQDSGQDLIEKLGETMLLHVFLSGLHVASMFVTDANFLGKLLSSRFIL